MTGEHCPSRADLIQRLIEVSNYFEDYRNKNGSYACRKHRRVSHYGKLAYRLIIDGFLFEETGDDEYLARGLRLVPELLAQLRNVDGHWVFYPGLLNPYNASNNAIDSGALVDCLSDWHGRFSEQTPDDILDRIRSACLKVASTYLPRTLDKLTNQMLWAATGLAGAYRYLEHRPEFRDSCCLALERAFADQNEDGSFPYLPERLRGLDHSSLHDVSGYYHSRHSLFLVDIARKIDYSLSTNETASVRKAADFLCALYDPAGRKSLEIEAKHWYWPAPAAFERASAAFDLAALADSAELFGEDRYRRYASHAAQRIVEGAGYDGSVIGVDNGDAFQCTHFWSAHLAWVARALRRGFTPCAPGRPRPGVFRGVESGVASITTKDWHLKIRTRRHGLSPLFGSYAAGSVWAAHHRSDGFRTNLLARERFSLFAPGEVFLFPRLGLSKQARRTAKALTQERAGFRFALALVRDALATGMYGKAARILRRVFLDQNRFLLGSASRDLHSSFWCLESELDMDDNRLTIDCLFARASGKEAHPTGQPTDGKAISIKKIYRLTPTHLEVSYEMEPLSHLDRPLFIAATGSPVPNIEGATSRPHPLGCWLVPEPGSPRTRLQFSLLPP